MWNKIKDFIYVKRFYICIIIWIVCIFFKLNGSSIGMWNKFMDLDTKEGVILGISRGIRSDEWATFSPMMFSQYFDGFKYYSDIIRADSTDVFMVYGLPVMNFLQIFRPFQLGFLFLGISYGLSFFWYGRLIALFIVTFEFMMILTRNKNIGNKYLSFVGALIVSLSPVIQWWFAVNGIVEIFFFGELALILLYKYLNCLNIKYRFCYLLLMVFCALGYILVLYPSWQIPMFYSFLSLAFWIVLDNINKFKFEKKDFYSIVVSLIIFITILIYIYDKSGDTIKIILNTVYPGKRIELGGHSIGAYFKMLINIFLPYKSFDYVGTNNCEMAVMFTLFPLGIFLSIVNLYKNKNKDKALICMLTAYIFLSCWCIIGFPSFLANITLLSKSQASRSYLAVGFLDILILIRVLSINNIKFSIKKSFIIASVLSVFITLLNIYYNKFFINDLRNINKIICIIVMITISFCLFYFCLRLYCKKNKKIFLMGIFIIMIAVGGTVNPIRYGTDNIYESTLIKDIKKINDDNNGIWISEGLDYPVTNFILMAGVPTLNSTNVYPNLDRWNLIDIDNKYSDIYNRYAHIKINYSESNDEDKFELISPDCFVVYLNINDLKLLNIKYIFTKNNFDNSELFDKIYTYDNYNVYKILV